MTYIYPCIYSYINLYIPLSLPLYLPLYLPIYLALSLPLLARQIEQLRNCEIIKECEVKVLCGKVREILVEEGNVQRVDAPVTVSGMHVTSCNMSSNLLDHSRIFYRMYLLLVRPVTFSNMLCRFTSIDIWFIFYQKNEGYKNKFESKQNAMEHKNRKTLFRDLKHCIIMYKCILSFRYRFSNTYII